MTEQVSKSHCEICGIDVKSDTDLKRFNKYFCSSEHMEQYVGARQRDLGLYERHAGRKFRC